MAIELQTSPSAATVARPSLALRLSALNAGGSNKVSARERMFFTERLALLLETGNALHGSLTLLSGQCESPALGRVATQLADDLAGGMPFGRALANHPDAFPQVYVSLVSAGEQGGFLPSVLTELTALEEKAAHLRATIVSAFSYPAFLLVFSVAVVIFIMTFVFPKFADLFRAIRDQLPFSTLALMIASDTLRQHWPILLGGGGGAAWGTWIWLKSPVGRTRVDRLKLRVPVLRDIFAQLYLAQSMRVMGLSLEHGVSVPDALRATRDVVSNVEFQQFMADVEREVNEGRGITPAFERTKFIPDLTRQLIATGEDSGNLPLVMGRLADHYERELSRRLESLAKLIEPCMLLVMGGAVGIIVSSLILPIFKLSRAVGV